MQWKQLLSTKRSGIEEGIRARADLRSEFEKDYHKIISSASLRRLQDKTQVFPLDKSDFIRTRLTHSLEVSSVGRSLAQNISERIIDQRLDPDFTLETEKAITEVIECAGLIHDIGNPPFGHAGEAAIREWFRKNRNSDPLRGLSNREMADFENFDGNAQGHRILSKLEYHFLDGGMRLTYATIGSMIKYPQLAMYGCPTSLFSTEYDLYEMTAETLGLPQIEKGRWTRHPLVYLMEAADDICYSILDVEDAIELGILSYGDVRDMFSYLCGPDVDVDHEYEENGRNFRDFLSSIRGKAIQNLIDDVAVVFVKHYEEIMNGTLDKHLMDLSNSSPMWGIRIGKRLGKERIYPDRRKTELEVGSYTTLATVLDAFINGVYDYRQNGKNSYRADRIVRLIGQAKIGQSVSAAEAYHQVLDFVSGMTDNYATYLARQIGGLAMGV